MKRFMLLAAMCAALVLAMAPAVMAQTSGPSGADGTFNCEDFTDQGQAQEFSLSDPGDTNGLDEDGDGIVCESLPTATPGGESGPILVPGEGESIPMAQYAQPVTPAQMPTTVPTTALPATGGPSLALLAGALLLGTGLVLRRR